MKDDTGDKTSKQLARRDTVEVPREVLREVIKKLEHSCGSVLKGQTYIAAWASKGTTFNLVECDDATYKRRPVGTFEDNTIEENRRLCEAVASLLNDCHWLYAKLNALMGDG